MQPARSPDLNILDRSLYCTLQTHQLTIISNNAMELIRNVKLAFWQYSHVVLNNCDLTTMDSMNKILACNGDNTYKIPHRNKDAYIKVLRLPDTLPVYNKDDANWFNGWVPLVTVYATLEDEQYEAEADADVAAEAVTAIQTGNTQGLFPEYQEESEDDLYDDPESDPDDEILEMDD
jgi:hypothetical protein